MKNITFSHRFKVAFTIIFQILIVVAAIMTAYNRDWQFFALSILMFFLTFLPSIYQRRFKITLPSEYEILLMFFIFASLYLGEIHDFYNVFHWWDIFLHTLSGVLSVIFALSLLLIMDREKRIVFGSPFFVVLFSFSVAMMFGGLWEIFEFFMDEVFGMNMQKTGLDDTMLDIINNTQGAFLASVVAYFQIKYDWKTRVIKKFNRGAKDKDIQQFTMTNGKKK